jgi:hypothetical protein
VNTVMNFRIAHSVNNLLSSRTTVGPARTHTTVTMAGPAIAQAGSRHPVTAEVRLRSVRPYGICGGQSDIRTRSPSTWFSIVLVDKLNGEEPVFL